MYVEDRQIKVTRVDMHCIFDYLCFPGRCKQYSTLNRL